MLEPKARKALLRGSLLAACARASDRIGHGVRLVEQDHAVKIYAEPVEDLLKARSLVPPV